MADSSGRNSTTYATTVSGAILQGTAATGDGTVVDGAFVDTAGPKTGSLSGPVLPRRPSLSDQLSAWLLPTITDGGTVLLDAVIRKQFQQQFIRESWQSRH